MTIEEFINHTYSGALVEIVDVDYRRLFYGRNGQIPTSMFDTDTLVLNIAPFEAEIEAGTFEPAIQIVVASRVVGV